MRAELRRAIRSDYHALVTVTIGEGLARGAAYVGLLRDISDGGVGVVLDCARIDRGTPVTIGMEGLAPVSARVCHCTPLNEGTLVGFSFVLTDTASALEQGLAEFTDVAFAIRRSSSLTASMSLLSKTRHVLNQ